MTNSTNSCFLNQFTSLNLTKSHNFTIFQNSLANLTNVNHSYKAVLGMLRNITENNESITRDQSKPDYTGFTLLVVLTVFGFRFDCYRG